MQGYTGKATPDVSVVCADVDGTVLATDLLYESLLVALKRRPWILFVLPLWLCRGRAFLKARIAESAKGMSCTLLPIHEPVVEYLRNRAAQGHRVILASASDQSLVSSVAQRLGFVDGIITSDGSTNCKGAAKAKAISEHLGTVPWEYVGDSTADFDVWRHSARAVCVASRASFASKVTRAFPQAEVIMVGRPTIHTLARALRVHQWMKNLLVFLPLVLAHEWLNISAVTAATLAAVSFSLCASGVYLVNDLLDLEADRKHPRKRKRPCASGELPLQWAILLAPILFCASFVIAWMVHAEFVAVLGLYLVLTTAYSLRLKALALVDIILLAMLYTIRIVGGGVAAHIVVSQWLLGLSMFLFLSLACVKRFSELLVLQQRNEKKTWGRGYWVGDLEQVAAFGAASGYISVLVLALYVSSNEIVRLYSNPRLIWLACPLLLYWVSRIWLLARRGVVHDDPLVFALRDKVTYIVAGLGLVIFVAAKFIHG
jgi:4-hydroxybenzoate polyprenyltransferase/phosphoserine phosphatase